MGHKTTSDDNGEDDNNNCKPAAKPTVKDDDLLKLMRPLLGQGKDKTLMTTREDEQKCKGPGGQSRCQRRSGLQQG